MSDLLRETFDHLRLWHGITLVSDLSDLIETHRMSHADGWLEDDWPDGSVKNLIMGRRHEHDSYEGADIFVIGNAD